MRTVLLTFFLFASTSSLFTQNSFIQKLNNNWTFKSVDDYNWLPATVPGSVHTDLLATKKLVFLPEKLSIIMVGIGVHDW